MADPLSSAPRLIVIGLGNPDRGDDGAGRAVAKRLRGELSPAVEVAEHDGEATGLLALFDRADGAVLVDACVSDAPPGTVRRFDVGSEPLPQAGFSLSTHGLGLVEAVELARALGQLPSPCIVYAIEAQSAGAGEALSPPVAAAVGVVSERVRGEIAAAAAGGRHHA